jgi:methylene-fatty-acyl-phospholipid synthase
MNTLWLDLKQNSLWIAVAWILFNPLFWNYVARKGISQSLNHCHTSTLNTILLHSSLEHSTHFLTRLAGSAHRGCYLLGVTIFAIGIIRDHLSVPSYPLIIHAQLKLNHIKAFARFSSPFLSYKQALENQPTHASLDQPIIQTFAKASFALGSLLVITSMWSLGFTGTYLGDYFGILMDHMVQGFPFNLTSSPMYNGSTLCFLGTALRYLPLQTNILVYNSFTSLIPTFYSYRSPAGVILTGLVYLVYQVALKYEELSRDLLPSKMKLPPINISLHISPFTADIYRQRDLKSSKTK